MNAGHPLAALRRIRAVWVGTALLAIAVVAAVVGAVLIVNTINAVPDRIDRRPNVPVPGEATLRLPRGERGVWLETKAPSRPDLRNIGVTITPVSGGEPLAVLFPRSVENYDLNGRRGALIGTVIVPETGDYLVVVNGRGGTNVSIGATNATQDLLDSSGPTVAFTVAGIAALLGMLMLLIALIRRIRRNATSEPQPS